MNVVQKSLNIMNRREKRTGLILLFLNVLKGLADTAGIASILPFLSVLGQPELVETNFYASRVYDAFGFESVDEFLFALGLLVVFLLVISAVIKIATVYATNRWIEMREYSLARRLLQTYLKQPYSFFLTRNSSTMSTFILAEVRTIAVGIYLPAINLFSSITSFILIFSLIFWANPLITLTAMLFIGTSYMVLYLSLRGFIKTKGEIILSANKTKFKRVNETFAGIKQVKLSALENVAFKLFSESAKSYAQARAVSTTLGMIPKHGLEVIAFGGIVTLTLILFQQNDGAIEKILPLLGLYAFAGYRLLPILQSIYNSFIRLRLGVPSLDGVYEELQGTAELVGFPRSVVEPLPLNDAIRLKEICYSYPETEATGLRKIDLEIPKGQSLGVVGTTGAGKTTLVDVLLGLLELDDGSILIDETPLDVSNVRNWQASVGYVPQDIFLSDATVAENIALGVEKSQIVREDLERAAKTAKLHEFIINDLPHGYETLVGERGVRLSGGQRQRLGIARALYKQPQVLVFDEATSALDSTTESELISEISQMSGDRTIIMIAHRLGTIRDCDQIVMLDKGRIVGNGKFNDLVEDNSHFREMTLHQ